MQYNDQFRPFRHNCSSLSGFEVPRRRGQPICDLAGPRCARAVRSSAPAGGGESVAECACARACKVIASVTHPRREQYRERRGDWVRVSRTWSRRGEQTSCEHRGSVYGGAGVTERVTKRGRGQSWEMCSVTESL